MYRPTTVLQLPNPEELTFYTEAQQANANELVEILRHADRDVFFQGWLHRVELTEQLAANSAAPESEGRLWDVVVGGVLKIAENERTDGSAVLDAVRNSQLDIFLQIAGMGNMFYSSGVEEKAFLQAAQKSDELARKILEINGNFIPHIFMNSLEFAVNDLALLIGKAAELKEVIPDLAFWIGDDDGRPTALSGLIDPQEELGNLESAIAKYQRRRSRDVQPVEPEHLVGNVSDALRAMGVIQDIPAS